MTFIFCMLEDNILNCLDARGNSGAVRPYEIHFLRFSPLLTGCFFTTVSVGFHFAEIKVENVLIQIWRRKNKGKNRKRLILSRYAFKNLRKLVRPNLCLPPLRGGCQKRGVVVRCERLRCTRLQHRTCKTRRGHFASHGLSAHGLSTERARLAGGTSLRSWFQKKCLLPAGIFIFFPKKVAATWWDFIFFSKQSGCYLVRFLFFFLRFWKLKLDFFPIKKLFRKTANNKKITYFKLITSEVSANLKNLFWSNNYRFWNFKLDFFPIKKVFRKSAKFAKIYFL